MTNIILGYVGTLLSRDGKGCCHTQIDGPSGYPFLCSGLTLADSVIEATENLKVIKSCNTYHGHEKYDFDNPIIGSVIVQPIDASSIDAAVEKDILIRAHQQFSEAELQVIARKIAT